MDQLSRHCEEMRSIDAAISGVLYYFTRLPRRFAPRNDKLGNTSSQ
ncbi:hypothetical protein RFEPED_0157 [Rickettsia felis str. Pedreira]|uniref:Uncharacterized protein n=1 Tax=Rickettsia felis str. Pedreira TaxID=1359196 RepID=A0A0F3MPX0_RICFI|nr:hypothetical protein [Rickettsia felis]KJV57790.1 hypothetical protein RFEPED_0157 [Rickettsia felis str. Pedreira]